MKLLKLKIAFAAVVTSSLSAMACEGDLVCVGEQIARNCTMCHGPQFQGYFVAPRLAGQKPQYVVNQLRDLLAHKRDNPYSQLYMWRASAKLVSIDPDGVRAVAAYFATLQPEAAADGHQELVAAGQNLFSGGEASENVPACAVCHGPNGVGSRNIPRIGGLSFHYLKRRLEAWGAGYHASATYPMPKIASNLSEEKIDALASYLSFIGSEESFK
jgi:cytochrome c553